MSLGNLHILPLPHDVFVIEVREKYLEGNGGQNISDYIPEPEFLLLFSHHVLSLVL
jgi:hypothetical protein